MSIATEITNYKTYLTAAWQSIKNKGGTLPTNKNAVNLALAISSIQSGGGSGSGGGSSSGGPTITDFCNALDANIDTCMAQYPVGTELEDTYDGQSAPLIVAMYDFSAGNTGYGNAVDGVFLIRKYAIFTPGILFDMEGMSGSWSSSGQLAQFLDGEYFNKCSSKIKEKVHAVKYPAYGGYDFSAKWSINSTTEVLGASRTSDGVVWDYWKKQTGLSSASDAANSNRICRSSDSQVVGCWLRTSGADRDQACSIDTDGSIYRRQASFYTTGMGVRPICFISKASGGAIGEPDD